MPTVLLLRHGETALNRSGALRGLVDVPLSAAGKWEAERLADRVRGAYAVGAIYTSPLVRARATAAAVGRAVGLDTEVDAELVDIDYGGWAGRDPQTFTAAEREAFGRWLREPEVPLPGAEDPRRVQARAVAALAARARATDRCLAIVSHDAILQLLLCGILGVPLRSYRGIAQHTATLNELRFEGERWTVELLNSTWHLDMVARETGASAPADAKPCT